jgi:hypothetical protein
MGKPETWSNVICFMFGMMLERQNVLSFVEKLAQGVTKEELCVSAAASDRFKQSFCHQPDAGVEKYLQDKYT